MRVRSEKKTQNKQRKVRYNQILFDWEALTVYILYVCVEQKGTKIDFPFSIEEYAAIGDRTCKTYCQL